MPEIPTPSFSTSLTRNAIVLQKEKTYFNILLVVSVIGWIVLTVTIFGLIYGLIGAFAAWLGSGLLSARLKSESVEVTKEQLPELYGMFEEVCDSLELKERPRFYILQHHGVLNAFASRHSGRNFIVIYSSLLEALGSNKGAIKFLIGHEIGHIQRNHILKRILLIPSMIIPMLGNAYHRACEATCDRFGLFAAGNSDSAARGLIVLAAGKEVSMIANSATFARQYYENRGFFVSWHELSSGYPTLSQRVAKVLGVDIPYFSTNSTRNPFAYIFSFVFSIQVLAIAYLSIFFGIAYFNEAKNKKTSRPAAPTATRSYPSSNQLGLKSVTPPPTFEPANNPAQSLTPVSDPSVISRLDILDALSKNFISSNLRRARAAGISDADIWLNQERANPKFTKARESGLSLDDCAAYYDSQAAKQQAPQ